MPKIEINSAARSAIRGQTLHGRTLHEIAIQVSPDTWAIDVDDMTVERLERVRAERGLASYSDAILWLVSNQRGHQ